MFAVFVLNHLHIFFNRNFLKFCGLRGGRGFDRSRHELSNGCSVAQHRLRYSRERAPLNVSITDLSDHIARSHAERLVASAARLLPLQSHILFRGQHLSDPMDHQSFLQKEESGDSLRPAVFLLYVFVRLVQNMVKSVDFFRAPQIRAGGCGYWHVAHLSRPGDPQTARVRW